MPFASAILAGLAAPSQALSEPQRSVASQRSQVWSINLLVLYDSELANPLLGLGGWRLSRGRCVMADQ